MAMRYCKDCELYECCRRTPLGGCQEFDSVAPKLPNPMTLEDAKQILKMEFDWDWEKFRREAAKDILAGMLSHHRIFYDESLRPNHVQMAISYTDELIKQLKEDKE